MGKNSGIEWCDHTWNPWMGCLKVSTGCVNCYMYAEFKRYGRKEPNVVRRSKTTFYDPLKWVGPATVFTCSWSDWFHGQADQWRPEAWEIIRKTPGLTYLILTKRPEQALSRLPADWGDGWPNVWIGASVENQDAAVKRIPRLLDIPAKHRFLSLEPLVGEVDLPAATTFDFYGEDFLGVDWVICGGESGTHARPCEPGWVRRVRDDCARAGAPFFFKGWGEALPLEAEDGSLDWLKLGRHRTGRALDGREWLEFPAQLERAAGGGAK